MHSHEGWLVRAECMQAAATTVVASVMHSTYVGLDITRKLTIPNIAELPTAPPVPGAAAQPGPGEALAATSMQHGPPASQASQDGMHSDPAAEAENAPGAMNKAAAGTPARVPDKAALHAGAGPGVQQGECINASDAECLSADTSHHAQVVHEELDLAQDTMEHSRPQGHGTAGSQGVHAWQAPMRQARISTLSRAPSTGGPNGRNAAGDWADAGQQLQRQQRCGHLAREAPNPDSAPVGSSGTQQANRADQSNATAQHGKQAGQLPLFEAFRFNASATPSGVAPRQPSVHKWITWSSTCIDVAR